MDLSVMLLKEACETYLKKFNNRINFHSQITSAIGKDKSKTKKLCLTLIDGIFKNEKEPYFLFLNDKELSIKLLNLIIKGIKEEIEFESFKLQLFSLSIDVEFIYKISEFYFHCFSKNTDDYWGEYINIFIFEKKFKPEYINNLLNMIGIKYNVKTYNDLLIKIKNKFNKSKYFTDELKIIFKDSDNKIENNIIVENKAEIISEEKEQNSEKYDIKNGNNNKSENEVTSQSSKLINRKAINEEYENDNVDDNKKNNENNKINENQIFKNINNSDKIIDNNIHNLELKSENNQEINSNQKSNDIIEMNPEDNKNIYKDGIEVVKINYTVYDYLNDQFNKYNKNKKSIYTPVLLNILKNSRINLSNIGYYDINNFDKYHKINDKTLSVLISDKLYLDNVMCDKKEYGYFCYEYENTKTNKIYTVEALYSIIDPSNLYNYCQLNDKIDNYNNPDSRIKNFYIKNRAMALDYYINISVFKEKYNLKPLPRIIFPLYNKRLNFDLLNEVELDGVFFVENEFYITDNDLSFIYQNFLSFSGSNKVYNLFFKVDLDGKLFKKNDLCLLEIKTEFPEKYASNNRETFHEVLEKMLEKMIIFEQLFTSLKIGYNRIRLILFYDLVLKINYTADIKNVLTNFAQKHKKLKYLNKICFQVIYVSASYFVGALKTNAEEIKNLKEAMENTKIESQEKDKEIEKLAKRNNELLIEIKKLTKNNNEILIENQKLMKKISEQNEKIINLQTRYRNLEQKIKNIEENFNKIYQKKLIMMSINDKYF